MGKRTDTQSHARGSERLQVEDFFRTILCVPAVDLEHEAKEQNNMEMGPDVCVDHVPRAYLRPPIPKSEFTLWTFLSSPRK
eukprot:217257-Prorocentrum_minimum.AAC.1